MRLIDADRLLSERMMSTYYHLPNGDTAIPIIDIKHAPTVSAEPQWIPCSEQLPFAEYGESPNVYCYCCDLEQGGKWTQLLYFNGGVWCLPTGETFDYKVLAWYPLPTKPYRKDGEQHG